MESGKVNVQESLTLQAEIILTQVTTEQSISYPFKVVIEREYQRDEKESDLPESQIQNGGNEPESVDETVVQ